MTSPVLAFDLFGTLVHPLGTPASLAIDTARRAALTTAWRRHQLEISWLLTVMGRYEDWSAVMGYALDIAAAEVGIVLGPEQRAETLAAGAAPELFDDVTPALTSLESAGWELAVLSNAAPDALAAILERTEIAARFTQVISAHEVEAFKPATAVYANAARRLRREPGDVWLVSGNPFDCAGANHAGLRVAKLERTPSFRYGFADAPDLTITSLSELADRLPAPT